MVLEKKLELVSEQHSSALLLRQHIHPMTPLVALEADFALSLGQRGGVRSDGREGQWGVWGGGGLTIKQIMPCSSLLIVAFSQHGGV